MNQPEIIMYTRPACPDVARAQFFLRQRGLDWDEIDIEADPAARAKVEAWNGGRAPTPTLWIGGTMLVEPGATEIDAALEKEAA